MSYMQKSLVAIGIAVILSGVAIGQGVCVALGMAIVGAAYPAYRCAQLPIAEALRGT